jgi:general stress protein 13
MDNFKKGEIIKGTVTGIEPYGIFVKFDDSFSGLIHISEISEKFVRNPGDFAKVGEELNVEVIDVDKTTQQMKLSIKNIQYRNKPKKKKIIETSIGFNTLEYKLPFWIEENLKKHKNISNSIDKI